MDIGNPFWGSEKCQHATECVKGTSKTFYPLNRQDEDVIFGAKVCRNKAIF